MSEQPRPVTALTVVGVLTLLVYAGTLTSGYAFDDLPIIVNNFRVHALLPPWTYFTQTSWPPEILTALYRPVTILGFALQWNAAGGAAWLFHAVSVALYFAIVLQVTRLAREVLPPAVALAVGALFAVHPVHVEPVANVVMQSELLVALAEVSAVLRFVRARRRGTFTGSDAAVIALLYFVSCFSKEHGIMLPALLLAVEFTVVADPRPLRLRLGLLAPLGRTLAIVGAGFLVARTVVLGGLAGDTANIAIRDVGSINRIITMLGVVPHWFRLLLAPWHLQADYMPRELDLATALGITQYLGIALLAAATGTAWWARRRCPVLAFGLLWCGIALFPVSNLLLPTGILLAERILLTPSVGAMLAVGGAAVLLLERLGRPGGHLGSCAFAVVAVLVLLGGARSVVRTRDWLDDDTIVPRTVIDAPRSYKARWDHARMLLRLGQPAAGAAEYRKALELFPRDARVLSEYADLRRLDGACGDAIPLYREAVRIAPGAWVSRTKLALCLAATGDLVGARAQAAELSNWPEADAARLRTQIESMARRPAVPVSPRASNRP